MRRSEMHGTVVVGPPGPPAIRCAVRLIAAGPALAVVARWRAELAILERRSPGSDAVVTLADCVKELTAAIHAGHDVHLQFTIAEAHAMSHIPISTLRWLCRTKPEVMGARKEEGVWYLDRQRFETYLATSAHTSHAAAPGPARAETCAISRGEDGHAAESHLTDGRTDDALSDAQSADGGMGHRMMDVA